MSLDQLASLLHVSPGEVARELGGGWTAVACPDLPTCWSSGEPVQVLLGWTDDGELVVAQPRIAWQSHSPSVRTDRRHLQAFWPGLESVAKAVRAAVVAERRRLRWCRHCRQLCSPGHMNVRGVCDPCASTHDGVVF